MQKNTAIKGLRCNIRPTPPRVGHSFKDNRPVISSIRNRHQTSLNMGLLQGVFTLICAALVAEGRFLIDAQNQAFPAVEVEHVGDGGCQKLVARAIVDLLVSEYNRVNIDNAALHVKAGMPVVQCKNADGSECTVNMELSRSTCKRTTSTYWFECQPTYVMEDLKRCTAIVNLAKAVVASPLRCHSDMPASAIDGPNGMYQGGLDDSYQEERMLSPVGNKIMKKKWDATDGNVQPF